MNLISFFVALGQVAVRFNASTCWDVRNRRGTLTLPANVGPYAVGILTVAMAEEIQAAGIGVECLSGTGAELVVTCPA